MAQGILGGLLDHQSQEKSPTPPELMFGRLGNKFEARCGLGSALGYTLGLSHKSCPSFVVGVVGGAETLPTTQHLITYLT